MATTLTVGSLRAGIDWTYLDGNAVAGSTNLGAFSYLQSFSNGTGASKAQKIYFNSYSIAGSAGTQSIDLSGSLSDVFANALTFATVKAIWIEHQTSTATGVLDLDGVFLTQGTGTPLAGTTPKIQLRPGYLLFLAGPTAGGYTVTNSTKDVLTLTNNDASSVTVKVCIIGE